MADHRRQPRAQGQYDRPRRAVDRAAARGGRRGAGQDQPFRMGQHPLVQAAPAAGARSAGWSRTLTRPTATPAARPPAAARRSRRASPGRRSGPRPTVRSPAPPRSTASSASSPPSASSAAPISCRSATARTRPGRWRRPSRDAALLLNAIAGSDPADPATAEADTRKVDFTAGLGDASLQGVRIGVLRKSVGNNPAVTALFEQALADLRAAGAVPVETRLRSRRSDGERRIHRAALRIARGSRGLFAFILRRHSDPQPRRRDRLQQSACGGEMRWFGQDVFEQAEDNDRPHGL